MTSINRTQTVWHYNETCETRTLFSVDRVVDPNRPFWIFTFVNYIFLGDHSFYSNSFSTIYCRWPRLGLTNSTVFKFSINPNPFTAITSLRGHRSTVLHLRCALKEMFTMQNYQYMEFTLKNICKMLPCVTSSPCVGIHTVERAGWRLRPCVNDVFLVVNKHYTQTDYFFEKKKKNLRKKNRHDTVLLWPLSRKRSTLHYVDNKFTYMLQ